VCGNRLAALSDPPISDLQSAGADQTGSINAKKHPTKVAKKRNTINEATMLPTKVRIPGKKGHFKAINLSSSHLSIVNAK